MGDGHSWKAGMGNTLDLCVMAREMGALNLGVFLGGVLASTLVHAFCWELAS